MLRCIRLDYSSISRLQRPIQRPRLPEHVLPHQPPILQLQPQHLPFTTRIAWGDAGVAVEKDAVVVIAHLGQSEEGGDHAGHAADVGEEDCLEKKGRPLAGLASVEGKWSSVNRKGQTRPPAFSLPITDCP